LCLVYVVSVASESTTPICKTLLANGVTLFMGMIDGEFFPRAKELLGGAHESDATAHTNTEIQVLSSMEINGGGKLRRKGPIVNQGLR
jgi:hypothetical protein